MARKYGSYRNLFKMTNNHGLFIMKLCQLSKFYLSVMDLLKSSEMSVSKTSRNILFSGWG